MLRIEILLLLASLFATTLALRGQSGYSVHRLVQEGVAEGHVAPKDEKTKSSKAPKSSKSSKGEKKCKKAKDPKMPAHEATDIAQDEMEVAEVEEAMPYCLHAALSAEECAAVKNGDLPKDDHNVKGRIEMEIEFDDNNSPKEVKRTLGDILRTETSSKFVGCEKSRRRRLDGDGDGEGTDSNESYLSITGLDFQQLEISKEGCGNPNTSGDDSNTNCNKIQADAHVFYAGKDSLSEEEKQEMFDLLVETIELQASTGAFAGVGEVKSVQASSVSDGKASGSGMPIGVAIGAVLVLGAVGGLFYYKRKLATGDRAKAEDHADTDDDESIVHAHAVLVEDDTKDKKKKEEVEEAFEVQAIPVSDSK